MGSGELAPALGRRFLLIAILVAVVPLGAIGFWATRGAARSGRMLLGSQLTSQLAPVQRDVEQRWERHKADLLMLGENEPVRISLLGPSSEADTVPTFVRRMFAQVSAFNHVTLRDRTGEERWSLDAASMGVGAAAVPAASAGESRDRGTIGESPGIDVTLPLTDLFTGDTVGSIAASLRVSSVLPAATGAASEAGPLTALVLGDRLVVPSGSDPQLFTDETAEWAGHRWLTVRQPTAVPGVQIAMAGPLDPYIEPFERAAHQRTAALLAAAGLVLLAMVTLTRRMMRDVERKLAHREALAAVGEFATELSHEVRNPLTAVRLDLQRAQEVDEPGDVRVILARVLRQIDRMDRAVTGALRVARGGSIEAKRVDLKEVLESARRGAEGELAQRAARASLELDSAEDIDVSGDAGALEQLFLNLLLNAAQALEPGGEVRVSAKKRDGVVEVRIADDGHGMTPDQLALIDRPYRSSRRDGTGLGLKIARRVVASHRGEMTVESEAGRGTTVSVRLP